jgi:beta-adrenergic-receptor kinase
MSDFRLVFKCLILCLFSIGIKLTDADQELYKNFPLVISERWQAEVADTVFHTINHDYDKIEGKKRAKQKKFGTSVDEKDSDCILHGYLRKQGGPFGTHWQTRYAKLYPNRLELHSENNKPELTFMDQIEEITTDPVQVKNEQCIVLRTRNDGKIVLTNSDEIGLKEWSGSLRSAHKCSLELLSGLAKKAGKIYGTTDGAAVSSSSTHTLSTTTSSPNNSAN